MILFIESVVLCTASTLMVYLISREPIGILYNYPPKIQERVKSLEEYKDRIPTQKNKLTAKLTAIVLFIAVFAVILRYVNGYKTFMEGFGYGFLLWTIVNLFDLIFLDIIWFCHDPHYVIKGTEDMTAYYHDYMFHFRGFLTGEALALGVCAFVGLIVKMLK